MDLTGAWRKLLRRIPGGNRKTKPGPAATVPRRADPVTGSLRSLLDDEQIPDDVRAELASEFADIERMLARLEKGELHVAVFGRVSTGKSALCNALLGRDAFAVGVLHGTTTQSAQQALDEASHAGLVLIDTPGINELDGEAREKLAYEVAEVSDLVVFVVDGDFTREELDALHALGETHRPLLVALNKRDRFSDEDLDRLLAHLRQRSAGLVQAENVVAVAALPAPLRSVQVDAHGAVHETEQAQAPDVSALRTRLVQIAEREGKELAAINAGLFAGRLTDRVSRRIAETRRQLASKLIRQYCLAKGVAVALNPVPVADLLAAAGLDAAMVVQLSRIYGLPLTRSESGRLVATISAQLIALMGAIWGVHLVASALKGVSVGLSTVVTAGFQGALAWYATTLIGRAAEHYLIHGKSWGAKGAKRAVREVVESLDRDSILREARTQILKRL